MAARVYDRDWREELTLRDGSRAKLRLVRPEDKALLLREFQRLSPESRFLRFFTDKTALTESELRYLTEMDQETHVAIAAGTPDETEGLGIARFVRLLDSPTVAEPAVVVVDGAQRKGLGSALLEHLARAAAERGVERFRCEVLLANEPMRALIQELAPLATFRTDGDVLTVEWPVQLPVRSTLARLLAWTAEGLLQLRHALFPGQERST